MSRTTQTARDQLVDDFKKIIDDAEELLKVTANETGGKIGAVRERAEANLREARRKLISSWMSARTVMLAEQSRKNRLIRLSSGGQGNVWVSQFAIHS